MAQGICLLSSRSPELMRDVESQVDLRSLESLFRPEQRGKKGWDRDKDPDIRVHTSWRERLLGTSCTKKRGRTFQEED